MFDQRWQFAAEQARQHSEKNATPLPLGFVTRVLARSRETPAESWEDLISTLGLRALIATTLIVVASGGYAFTQWYEPRLEVPVVDQGLTAELSWP